MKTYMDYSRAAEHILAESAFEPRFSGKCEAVMSQGNGYLGLRACAEEEYVQTTRGLFINGTFDRFDAEEVSELPNAADSTELQIELDGQRFSLERGKTISYSRELNLRTGLLERKVVWESPDGQRYALEFARFVSLARMHDFALRVRIRCEAGDADRVSVSITGGINGAITNSGTQHFSDGAKRYYDGKYLQLVQTTSESGIAFVHTAAQSLQCEGEEAVRKISMPRRAIRENQQISLGRGQTLEFVKYCSVFTTRDLESKSEEELKETGLAEVRLMEQKGFDALFEESTAVWEDQVWKASPIEIDSDNPRDQLAIDFAQYHLRVMVPRHDNRMNIGAKGLSGEGYKGHCFWDTEIFILPYYSFTDPEAAKKLEEYRYLTLPGAHAKAKANGYSGAMFPWESAWIEDGDVTPEFVGANVVTGLPTKVWSGHIEQHITADVAYGVWQYYLATGDQEFMDRCGYEIILDAARFWSSRLEWSDADEMYHINDVIGADEYKEHCNDNSLTNYLAKWNMEKALDYCAQLEKDNPELYASLAGKLELADWRKKWEQQIPKIFLNQPREDGVVGQDRDYLSYPEIDLTKYKNQTQVDTILQDYNQTQLSKIQVTKQADLLILLFMLEDLFPREVKKACWEYYEPKTTHDSSLSYCTHCVLASDMDDPALAVKLFAKSNGIDMGESMVSSDAGIHAASLGGIWQCVVMGFGGLRLGENGLRIDPKLPPEWKSLSYQIWYRGEKLAVEVRRAQDGSQETVVRNLTGKKAVNVTVQGQLRNLT